MISNITNSPNFGSSIKKNYLLNAAFKTAHFRNKEGGAYEYGNSFANALDIIKNDGRDDKLELVCSTRRIGEKTNGNHISLMVNGQECLSQDTCINGGDNAIDLIINYARRFGNPETSYITPAMEKIKLSQEKSKEISQELKKVEDKHSQLFSELLKLKAIQESNQEQAVNEVRRRLNRIYMSI